MGAGPVGEEAEHEAVASGGTAAPAPPPQVQAADSIDLFETAGAPVLKRAVPAAVGLGLLLLLVLWIVRRRK
jgi:hypothetical protein